MIPWPVRPPEVAHLVNPAFIALILREIVGGYKQQGTKPMDVNLSFLAVPLVLHGETRVAIPTKLSTKHHVWLENNPSARVELASRCKALVPYVKEATIFGCRHGLLVISDDLGIDAPKKKLSSLPWDDGSEPKHCLKVARFVGRWFAEAGTAATIYSLWGLRP